MWNKRFGFMALPAAIVATVAFATGSASANTVELVRITGTGTNVADAIHITYENGTYLSQQGMLLKIGVDQGHDLTISEIYLQDGTWVAPPPYIVQSSNGVAWETSNVSPPHLPGANGMFVTDSYLSSQASGNNATGINGGESLELFFAYLPQQNFNTVEDAFAAYNFNLNGVAGMAIGLHVTSIGECDSSQSYVSTVPNAVPLPAAAWMGLSTLVGGGLLRLRKRKV